MFGPSVNTPCSALERRRELRLRHTARRLREELLLPHLLEIHVEPRGPSLGELALEHAAKPELRDVLDTLLLFGLKLFLQQALHLGLLATPRQHRLVAGQGRRYQRQPITEFECFQRRLRRLPGHIFWQ